jgi:putative toxin-antitoxin system antitoxin component (TIGR02293 family)
MEDIGMVVRASEAAGTVREQGKALGRFTDAAVFGYARLKAGLSGEDVATLVRDGRIRRSDVEMVIPARTLNRRIKEGQTLRLDEADAVARLVRVRGHAERVFDDAALAERWLSAPNPELGDETPIEMARTDVGAREVEAVLLRIEHGVVG